MLIRNLFSKDVFRPIDGVVQVHQWDESSAGRELEEFVVTAELAGQLGRFLSAYLAAIDNPHDPAATGRMGVWISGSFGSGKSHLLKVLAHLLGNRPYCREGRAGGAVEMFEDKVQDAALLADLRRAAAAQADVILLNVDAKADRKWGRREVTAVFLGALNELQGYDGDHPHIAHLERYLDGRGKLAEFQAAYAEITGGQWRRQRAAYQFHRDQVVEAFQRTLDQSRRSAEKWIDNAEDNFSLTVESFAGWVKEYLDRQGPGHRLIFLADEIGQFIGSDGRQMLSLQTIVEELGRQCQGRAWVVVTSQEELDAAIGELRPAAGRDCSKIDCSKIDFSKIHARFAIRLSLTSANVDEVVRQRLLAKREGAAAELKAVFSRHGDVLRNQLAFRDWPETPDPYADPDDFARHYPFVPYQLRLVQRIFQSVRRVGAAGRHLSGGERSVLGAFQSACQTVASGELGLLVPLDEFYPAMERLLDATVKQTMDRAAGSPGLGPFEIRLLKVLLLVRYVDRVKGNVDNLVTLCLDRIDADRLAVRRRIQQGLARLESQTLVDGNGEVYSFLTSLEREVSREIKAVELDGREQTKLLAELIFQDVLRGQRKHRHPHAGTDFGVNRVCDAHPVGRRVQGGLLVSVVSPLADDYGLYDDARCVLESGSDGGRVVVRLEDDQRLGRELRAYAQTEKYLKAKCDDGLPDPLGRILRRHAEANRQRRATLTALVEEMLGGASYFAAGGRLGVKAVAPAARVAEALDYLVANTFSKMGYLECLSSDPIEQSRALLCGGDHGRRNPHPDTADVNPRAIEDLRGYLELCSAAGRRMVLYDVIAGRYGKRPYGWPPMEAVLLVSRLIAAGEIDLIVDGAVDGAALPIDRVHEAVSTPAAWRKVTLVKRHTADPPQIDAARRLGKEIFAEMGPDDQDALFAFLRAKLLGWQSGLAAWRPLAETGDYPGDYPGRAEIAAGLDLIESLVGCDRSGRFINRFNGRKDDLLQLGDAYLELEQFYRHQRPTWDRLRKAYERFRLNRMELERDQRAGPAFRRMEEILNAAGPYSLIKEAEPLIAGVQQVNSALLRRRRARALQAIDAHTAEISRELQAVNGNQALKAACLGPLQVLRQHAQSQDSLAHVAQAESEAARAFDEAITRIEKSTKVTTPRCNVKPAELTQTACLETAHDIDRFLNQLRGKLEEALDNGRRIRIQ